MIEPIYTDKEFKYSLYKTNVITENLLQFKYYSKNSHLKFKDIFGQEYNKNTTDGYKMYNLFQLNSGSIIFFKLYEDLKFAIKDYLKDKTDIPYVWFTSWINYHKSDEVLDWHAHDASYHGYLSVDPKNTTTEFKKYSIKNEPGLVYIGPSFSQHRVVVNEPFEGHRTTIAFDIVVDKNNINLHLGYFPLV